MNEIIAGSIYNLSNVDALYCVIIDENMWWDYFSCVDQDMLFIDVDIWKNKPI